MKKNIYLALMLVVTLSAVDVLGVETMSLGTLEKFIQDGMANNPKIQQAYNQWQAAEYKIKVVKSLEDPMVSYGYFGEEVQTRVGPQEQKYDISQRVPFPGKRRLKEKAQEKHARMLEEKYEAVKVAIITEIKLNYYDLFWIDQAIEINEEEKSILVRLEKVAQRKYESNLIPQQDVIKAQVELSKSIEKLYLLNQIRKSLAIKMNNILNRDSNIEIPKVKQYEMFVFEYSLEDILSKAKSSQQEVVV
ncbi:MAG: TolC family protein, partial [Candidatus Omnitrophica bacterium]|nr:TolC family protein [Candidatus Omnitrophota bacterium]